MQKLGRGCTHAHTHPFAHPVCTPHLHPCAQTGCACVHPPLSAHGQQSTWKRGGAHMQWGRGAQRRRRGEVGEVGLGGGCIVVKGNYNEGVAIAHPCLHAPFACKGGCRQCMQK